MIASHNKGFQKYTIFIPCFTSQPSEMLIGLQY